MGSSSRSTICPTSILQQYSIAQLQLFFKNNPSEQLVFEQIQPDFTPNEEQRQVLKYVDASLSTFGKVSSEIGGQTIHSLLPIGYYKNSNYAKLAKKIKRSPQLVEKFEKYSAIIIDEISCCNASLFQYLNLVLQVAKLCKTSFGGLHVVVCGDALQLNCVCATSLTSHSKNVPPFAKEGIKLFRTFHPVFVLQVNQRQNGDEAFQELLMRLRRKVTQADVDLLNSRRESVLSSEELARFDQGLYIFPRNIFTRIKNHESLKQLGNPIISLKQYPAEPKLEDYDCDAISIGCKVKVRRNFDVANRLVSGSVGTVEAIIYDPDLPDLPLPSVILLSVPRYRGPTINGLIPIPISKQYVRDYASNENVKIYYYPLTLNYASSVHSSQGVTLPCCSVLLDDDEMCPGISYVALSRVRALSDLMILDKEVFLERFQTRRFFQGFRNILKEYKRLNILHLIFGPKPLERDYYLRDSEDESEPTA
ncbi:ATP-dependent DNA helicase pif1 [Folsomia candida]|uniref:ATP-dependent DNA helicase pif1 n=1 Tax=Folsomia candida TaxID=158441 RepID=UPI000B8EFEA2|nr:ATP-dependent DNA helicase pif1 [Folsomia candida]